MAIKIVNKQMALKLKELGFDMPVTRAFNSSDYKFQMYKSARNYNNPIFEPFFSAPSYDEVLHWLRDKHKMHSDVVNCSRTSPELTYNPVLQIYGKGDWIDVLGMEKYADYNKAQLAIIEKAIELLEDYMKYAGNDS